LKKRIWVLTLFPEFFEPFKVCGVTGQVLSGDRGAEFELITIQLRDFAPGNYKAIDDAPFGGGPGMVMRADILEKALLKGVVETGGYGEDWKSKLTVVFPSPRGVRWDNSLAREFARNELSPESMDKDLVFLCGRYEGVDERCLERYVDQQISLGDYVLTGGELAVMTILDSSLRFHDGTLGNADSANFESFEGGLLEHPLYTRPRDFAGEEPPAVVMSGHHAKIEAFHQSERERLTKKYRPDLWNKWKEEHEN